MNGHITLDRLMFDNVRSFPSVVTAGCVRDKAYVCPHIYDDVAMHVVVKGDVFELIGHGLMKNGIMLI